MFEQRRGAWPRIERLASGLMLVMLLFAPGIARGQDASIDRESKIKAAYILKFLTYVEWPAGCFADETSPLVLGVAGESRVTPYVELIARKRVAGNRSLVFRHVDCVEDARSCHLLFISGNVDRDWLGEFAGILLKAPILIVGEEPDAVTKGEVITFAVQDNRVRLQLSMQAALQRNLKISSQLAKLAEVVD